MSKQSMREEAERLIRETMEKRNLVVKQGNTRIEAVCGKCGAPEPALGSEGRDAREICLQAMRPQAGNAVAAPRAHSTAPRRRRGLPSRAFPNKMRPVIKQETVSGQKCKELAV